MLRAFGKSHASFCKYFGLVTFAVAGLLVVGNAVAAEKVKNDRAARLLATIPVPVSADNSPAGGLYSFDISWIDQATEIYYLADRSNKRVDIFDANTGTFLTQLMPRHPSRGFRGPVSRPPTPAQTASLSPGIVCL